MQIVLEGRHWCCMLVISCAISTAVRLNSDLLVTSLESDKGFQWYGMCFDLISFRKTGMNFHDSQNNVKQLAKLL